MFGYWGGGLFVRVGYLVGLLFVWCWRKFVGLFVIVYGFWCYWCVDVECVGGDDDG